MTFRDRVEVVTTANERLYSTHRAGALRLVREGTAERIDKRRVRLLETPGRPSRPCSRPSLMQFMGQRYTYREHLRNAAGDFDHQVVQLKPIDERDRPIFLLSVTDCLVA